MSVLVEAISVVIRKTTIEDRYPGGIAAYKRDCPNQTFCADEHLTRVGFMVPSDVRQYVGGLQLHGLAFAVDGVATDIAVVDQMRGPTVPCAWLRFGKRSDGTSQCWLRGQAAGELATPRNWARGGLHFLDPNQESHIARGGSDGLDEYEDRRSGKRMFVGRTRGAPVLSQGKNPIEIAREKAATPDGKWRVGDRLGGKWPIYRVMKGGMGLVYVVHDADRGELVAAKTFQDAIFRGANGDKVVERFNVEAKIWVSLGAHENIVHAFNVRNIDGKPYLFMEYVDGMSLSELVRSGQLKGDHQRVLELAQDFASGMEYACSHGLGAHRDVKPDNCLVTTDGKLKVTDFGLAKSLANVDAVKADRAGHAGTMTDRWITWYRRLRWRARGRENGIGATAGITVVGTAAGTPTHMAPEQFVDARSVDVRADIYAFGVLMYEMLSNKLPFVGSSFEELAMQHMSARPSRISGISESLWSGVAKCLEKDPRNRFSSFREVSQWIANERGRAPAANREVLQPQEVGHAEMAMGKAYTAANLVLFEEALQWCDDAFDNNPREFEAWSLRGRILIALGRGKEAIEAHERATRLSPTSAEAWHAMGAGMNALGRNAEALNCYERSLRCFDQFAQAWYDKGVAHRELGQLAEAGRCWDRCIQLAPDNSMAWCNRGGIHDQAGDAESAMSCYRRAVELNAGDGIAWYNLGLLHSAANELHAAVACFETAEQLGMPLAGEARRRLAGRMQGA